jgi:oxaloacetate decarboxylase alpha subunit
MSSSLPSSPKPTLNFDLDTVREVAQILRESEMAEICIETTGDDETPARLLLRRGQSTSTHAAPVFYPAAEAIAATGAEDSGEAEEPSVKLLHITATAVGVFHPAPKGVVKEGDTVKARQVLGIVESLRVPNEITCPVGGRVHAVLAAEGQGVEFGQLLFEIEETA